VGTPLLFVLYAGAGAWQSFWTLFGTSNQLLAALSLLGVSVWLKATGKRYWYTFWPMVFVVIITVSSLVLLIHQGFLAQGPVNPVERINAAVAALLLVLAASIAIQAARAFGMLGRASIGPATGAGAS
jgi:carbon starvation protein